MYGISVNSKKKTKAVTLYIQVSMIKTTSDDILKIV